MTNKKYFRVFDPENNNKEIKFRNLKELVSILQEWLISDILIEAIYGTIDIKYTMTRDEIADHLATGHMGKKFEKYGRKHKRAKLILDHIAKRE
tara:strand:- start:426 stop:707 length:282 start_codon:yes stop_codon:yes gene_type:complete